MRKVLLARFGEVHLKGQNRPYFMRVLVDNVKKTYETYKEKIESLKSAIEELQ